MSLTLYQNIGNTPKQRLRWVANGGWSTTYTSLKDFLNASSGIGSSPNIQSDLGSLSEAERRSIVKNIYVNYVRDDIRKIAKKYTDATFPVNPGDPPELQTLNRTKADLVNTYFEGKNDDIIVNNYLLETNNRWILQFNGSLSKSPWPKDHLDQLNTGTTVNNTTKSLLSAYGFTDWLAQQDETSFFTADEIGSMEALENLTTSDQARLDTLKTAVRAAKGLPATLEVSIEEQTLVNQCALITDLLHKGLSYTAYPQKWGLGSRGNDADCKAYSGRIYPVRIDRFDPDSLINLCTMPKGVKDFFNNTANETNKIEWNLYWVYMDSTGVLQEELIHKSNVGDTTYSDKRTELLSKQYFSGLDQTEVNDHSSIIDTNNIDYTITQIDVIYDGTNPSTARNDVKAKLTIKLGSLAAINATCCYAPLDVDVNEDGTVDRNELVEVKISDLVSGTQTNSYESRIVGSSISTSEFIPDTSRIRLKGRVVYTSVVGGILQSTVSRVDTQGTDIILDLSVTGHNISRDSDTGDASLTIDYRGYFEQAMNMPYNDALADEALIQAREGRKDKIRKARQNQCSSNLIREILRVNQEQERLEVEQFHADGGLLKRIYDSGFIYSYDIDQNKISTGQNGNILDPRLNYINSIVPMNQFVSLNSVFDTGRVEYSGGNMTEYEFYYDVARMIGQNAGFVDDDRFSAVGATNENIENIIANLNNRVSTKMFFLGDLMELLLDCIYEMDSQKNRTAKMRKSAAGLNMRFIVGTIRVPDPTDLNNYITINPLQIPVDLAFFTSWYHDTVIKKGVTHYPVGVFIKDLVERLINDVIYDTCFSLLLPDEQPPQLRMTFFSDCDTRRFKTYSAPLQAASRGVRPGVWFDPEDPYDTNFTRTSVRAPNILMKKNISTPSKDIKNYCVIYQQFPSYFRQLKYQKNSKLKDDPYCPTLYYGYNMKDLNYLSNIKFSKSDTTYLKEARFFSNQVGGLNLLSNVYDLDFDFNFLRVNTFFYPGNIVNFILTEFDGGNDNYINDFNTISSKIDQSDPHKDKTLANTLGMGGYHIIKSVSYSLNNKPSENVKISISTKYNGTDALSDGDPPPSGSAFANEQKRCLTQYDMAVNSIRATEISVGQTTNIERIYDEGVADNTGSNTTSPQATRVSDISNGSPAIITVTPSGGSITPSTNQTSSKLQSKYTFQTSKRLSVGTMIDGSNIDPDIYNENYAFEVVSIDTSVQTERKIKWKITDPNGGVTNEEVIYK